MIPASQREGEFDCFFRSLGFDRVSNIIGPSPGFPNADYIHRERKIVAELKVLDTDWFRDGGIIDRFCSLVPAPVNVTESGIGIYSLRFPGKNREGKHDTFEEPIRRILKKANKQIRETKARLLSSGGVGFLVLALNGFRSLNPDWIAILLRELLGQEFHEINGVLLCTPGLTETEGLWCSSQVARDSDNWANPLCIELGKAWCEFADRGEHEVE